MLNRGLKFIPAPPKVDKQKIRAAIAKFGRRIRIAHHFSQGSTYTRKKFLPPSTWEPPEVPEVINEELDNLAQKVEQVKFKTPKSNLSKQEILELKNLKQKSEIIIKPADKGAATVIMDTENYVFEAEKQLANRKHYQPLEEPIYIKTVPKFNKILMKLEKKKFLNERQVEYLTASEEARPRQLYLLPKIHKDPGKWTIPEKMPPGRPIISDCSSESYTIASYIDHFLAPLATIHPSYLRDTQHFLEEIAQVQDIPEDALLITIDVTALYTNIENKEGVEAVKTIFQQNPDPERPDEEILELLKLSLENNDFEFNGKWYLQTWGTAMGKKFAPNYANIFMAKWEKEALNKCNRKPLFYKRFLDDIKILWTHGRQEFQEFFDILNSHHESITLTYEINDRAINFLDTTVYKGERFRTSHILDTKVFIKPTDSLQLLHTASFHPKHTFKGIIKSQIIRYARICNNKSDLESACKRLFRSLRTRGYSARFLRRIKSEVLTPKSKIIQGGSFRCNQPRCGLCKYVENTKKVMDYFHIPTFQHCGSENGIYLLECSSCEKGYVGETKNSFRTRITQHLSDIALKKPTSVSNHVNQGDCKGASFKITFLETFEKQQADYLEKSRRLQRERFWTQTLVTYQPTGLNEIYNPEENPIVPLVLPYSETAQEIAKLARDTYARLQAKFPRKLYHKFLPAYSRNKNLKDHLVRSAFGKAPKPGESMNNQPEGTKILIAIPANLVREATDTNGFHPESIMKLPKRKPQ